MRALFVWDARCAWHMRDAFPLNRPEQAGAHLDGTLYLYAAFFLPTFRFSRKSAWSPLLLLQVDCARSFILPNQKSERRSQEGCHQLQTNCPTTTEGARRTAAGKGRGPFPRTEMQMHFAPYIHSGPSSGPEGTRNGPPFPFSPPFPPSQSSAIE